MDSKLLDTFIITQEECAEVIQSISKCLRFGLDTEYQGISNIERLTEEMSSVELMIDLIKAKLDIQQEVIEEYKLQKIKKLEVYSNLYT